jgi:hypothetical protein
MKKRFLFTLIVAPMAFAHGPVAKQASEAVDVAVNHFIAKQPKDVQRQFASVFATKTGHEKFAVTIKLIDGKTQFAFNCIENEDVDPIVWECVEAN